METAYEPTSTGQPAPSASTTVGSSAQAASALTPSPLVSSSQKPAPLPPTSAAPRSNPSSFSSPPPSYSLPPRVPPRSYLSSIPPALLPSLLPRFLRTLALVLSLVLGTSAIGTWIWAKLIVPRLMLSRQAKNALIEDHSDRLTKLQEGVDKLMRVGLVKIIEKPKEEEKVDGTESRLAIEAGEELDRPVAETDKPKLIEPAPTAPSLEHDELPSSSSSSNSDSSSSTASPIPTLSPFPDPPAEYLPSSPLSHLSPLLPLLSSSQYPAQPSPISLTQTLRSVVSHLNSQSLLFSSRTSRTSGGVGLASLSRSLEGAGGGSSSEGGAAWGGGLGEGEKEIIGLVSGMRGDVRGLKGLLISRRTFKPARSGTGSLGASNGQSFGFGRPASPAVWTPPPPVTPSSSAD